MMVSRALSTVNPTAAPPPGRVLAKTVPPWDSATSRTMARPSPAFRIGVAAVGLLFSMSWMLERAALTSSDPFDGVQARDDEADPQIVTSSAAWVHTNFGVGPARSAAVVGAFLGDSRDTGVAARHLFDRRDADLLPALIWLAAAVVEQYGDGDVSWLPHGHRMP